MVEKILGNPTDDVIELVLTNLAIGCTVTTEEHKRLSAFDRSHEGWGRYRAAGVEVVDMVTGEQVDLTDQVVD